MSQSGPCDKDRTTDISIAESVEGDRIFCEREQLSYAWSVAVLYFRIVCKMIEKKSKRQTTRHKYKYQLDF
jgi:hypothetical protein